MVRLSVERRMLSFPNSRAYTMSRRELGHGRHRRREDEQRRETIGDETIRGEKREGYYGQFTSQIHEKEIEKRGKYIQWHEKSSCTCLEFYFCKIDFINDKPTLLENLSLVPDGNPRFVPVSRRYRSSGTKCTRTQYRSDGLVLNCWPRQQLGRAVQYRLVIPTGTKRFFFLFDALYLFSFPFNFN